MKIPLGFDENAIALEDNRTYTMAAQPKFTDLPDIVEEEVECVKVNYPQDPKGLIKTIAKENNITNNYTLSILIAISRLETGNWKSPAFVELNNFGGMSENEQPIAFNSKYEGCEVFVKNLIENYINEGLTTPEEIGAKYCPVNPAWPELIREIMEEEYELL